MDTGPFPGDKVRPGRAADHAPPSSAAVMEEYNGITLPFFTLTHFILKGDRGGTVVKVLCYKSEGRWFDSSWCHWNFSLT